MYKSKLELRKKAEKKARKLAKRFKKDHAKMIRVPFVGSDKPILCTKEQYPWITKEAWRADDAGYPIRDPHPGEVTGTVDQNGKPVVYLINEVLTRNGHGPLIEYGLPAGHARNVSYDDLGRFLEEKLHEAKDGIEHDLLVYLPEQGKMEIRPSPAAGCDGTLRFTRAFAEEHHLDFDRLLDRLAGWSFRKEIRCDCDWFLNIQARGVAPIERTIFHEALPTPAEVAKHEGWYCRMGEDGLLQCQEGEPGAFLDLERVYAVFEEVRYSLDGEEGCGCDGDGTCDIPAA
jgi:hypothetical protein